MAEGQEKEELEHEWAGTTYGNGTMHRWLIKVLKVMDVRLLYLFSDIFIVPVTMIVNSPARKVIYRYFRKRHGYGRLKSAWMTYRNHCAFSEVIIDKFSMYAGKKFRITVEHYDRFKTLADKPEGFIQLSSHVGNYEIAGYSLVAEKRFNALVFGGEKETVMANRSKLFEEHNINMIPVREDMSHVFEADAALSRGEILSMPADRIFGSQKSFEYDFLGSKALFPQGPFMMAAVKELPMLFVAVMKDGWRSYRVFVESIPVSEEQSVRKRARESGEQYVRLLESIVQRYPEQWYNYFEFWKD